MRPSIAGDQKQDMSALVLSSCQTPTCLETGDAGRAPVRAGSDGRVKRWPQPLHWNQYSEECESIDFRSVTRPRSQRGHGLPVSVSVSEMRFMMEGGAIDVPLLRGFDRAQSSRSGFGASISAGLSFNRNGLRSRFSAMTDSEIRRTGC